MLRIPDLEAWAAFLATAEEGSMTRAARALGVTRATVSRMLARLEQKLGAPLFHRTTRRLALSPLGAETLESARAALAAAARLEEAAGAASGLPAGRVRLAAPLDFGQRHIAPHLADFLARHPGIEVELMLDDARVDIIAGGFDLVVRIGPLADSSLRARRLCGVALKTVAAPPLVARLGAPARPADLSLWPCLRYANQPDPRAFFYAEGARQAVRGPLVANNGAALLAAARAGLGAAQLPDFLVDDDLARGTLVELLQDRAPRPLDVYLLAPPAALRPARARLLAGHLAATLGAGGIAGD
jgi:DNA-binding transcriptional LysR family regulator